jgi:hypothetical protein
MVKEVSNGNRDPECKRRLERVLAKRAKVGMAAKRGPYGWGKWQ